MIRFEQVSKTYNDEFTAIKSLDLNILKGELLVLIGPSGCGKTTAMKMINRLIEPSEGRIFVDGADIAETDPVELRRNIGYVIQNIGLFPHMTIADNVALVPRLKKWPQADYIERVNELLKMVDLDPTVFAGRYPGELSGGQQQRIGVIRAMAANPPIILMDEPFSALDPISREQLQDELVNLQAKLHKTIVFVTHDMDEALKIANRICVMKEGEIMQIATPEDLLRHPANDFVRSFIGESRLSAATANILPKLSDIIIKPTTVQPSRYLAEALNILRNKKVDTLLVVDSKERLLGVVDVWSIMRNYSKESCTVADIMSTALPSATADKPLEEAVAMMSDLKLPYLAVTDENKKLLGIITRGKLVDVMASQLIEGREVAC